MVTFLYQRTTGGTWYFQYTHNGKRHQKSTGTADKQVAQRLMDEFIENGFKPSEPTLRELLLKYQSDKTHPAYLFAKKEGLKYSENTLKSSMVYSKQIVEALEKHTPKILSKTLSVITRADAMAIREGIIKFSGRRGASQYMLTTLKSIFSHQVKTGQLNTSPFKNIASINYKRKTKSSIEPELITWIMKNKEQIFSKQICYVFFCTLALTGMRAGEAQALNINKLKDNVYTVDSQKIRTHENKISYKLPKRDVIRIIPLCNTLVELLNTLTPSADGYYFKKLNSLHYMFKMLRERLIELDPVNEDVWSKLTPHSLRHSLNTNLLLIAEQPPMLVAEYLSWKHQDILDIQTRYTHIMAKNLRKISDAIDNIYSIN